MNYRNRLTLLIFLDSIIIAATIFVAFWVVYPFSSTSYDDLILTITAIALLFFHHIFAMIYKLYNKVWAYASVGELTAIVKSVTFTVGTAAIIQFFINDFSIYKRAMLVTWMMYIIVIGGSRFVWRIFRDRYISKNRKGVRTLIVGAGDAGAMIARQLNTEHNESNLMPVAFVDDDINKQYMEVYNLPVVGQVRDIPHTTERMEIEHIVIAIPSLKSDELKKIVESRGEKTLFIIALVSHIIYFIVSSLMNYNNSKHKRDEIISMYNNYCGEFALMDEKHIEDIKNKFFYPLFNRLDYTLCLYKYISICIILLISIILFLVIYLYAF